MEVKRDFLFCVLRKAKFISFNQNVSSSEFGAYFWPKQLILIILTMTICPIFSYIKEIFSKYDGIVIEFNNQLVSKINGFDCLGIGSIKIWFII